MNPLIAAFWRAAAYCLHPKVMLLSLAPLALAAAAVLGLGWAFWEPSVDGLRQLMDSWEGVRWFKQALRDWGAGGFVRVIEPLVIVALAVPVVVVLTLLLVSVLMSPAVVRLVAARRFPRLERRQGAAWWQSVGWSLACSAWAVLLLVISLPLWLVPPFFLLLPPLIWGWLTYRVMAFDALAEHATAAERSALLKQHRWPLLAMGVICGYLGAAPSLIWAAGALTLVFAPLLLVVSVWLYTLVFAFSALWFALFCLDALERHRAALVPAATQDTALLDPLKPPPIPPPAAQLPRLPS